MAREFTIIDSFRVTAALQQKVDGLALGIWFVLDGRFQSAAELPPPGISALVLTPTGEQFNSSITDVEVRNGSAAVMLSSPPEYVPRLSTLELLDNGL